MIDKYLMIGILDKVTVYGTFDDKNSADMAAVLTKRRQGRGFATVHTIVTKCSGVTDEELAAERKVDSDKEEKRRKDRNDYFDKNPDYLKKILRSS